MPLKMNSKNEEREACVRNLYYKFRGGTSYLKYYISYIVHFNIII